MQIFVDFKRRIRSVTLTRYSDVMNGTVFTKLFIVLNDQFEMPRKRSKTLRTSVIGSVSVLFLVEQHHIVNGRYRLKPHGTITEYSRSKRHILLSLQQAETFMITPTLTLPRLRLIYARVRIRNTYKLVGLSSGEANIKKIIWRFVVWYYKRQGSTMTFTAEEN